MHGTSISIPKLSICLRCQYRLLYNSTNESITTRARRRLQPKHQTRSISQRLVQDDPDLIEDTTAGAASSLSNTSEYKYPSHINSLRQNRGVEDHATKKALGVQSLGKTAEALVIKDLDQKSRRLDILRVENLPSASPETVPSNPRDLIEELRAEQGIPDLDRVCSTIDSLNRFHEGSSLIERGGLEAHVYDETIETLQNGFERSHMREYIRRCVYSPNEDNSKLLEPFSSSGFTRTAWTPGTRTLTEERKRLDQGLPSLQTLVSRDRSKPQLARTILEYCWRAHRLPEENTTGTITLRSTESAINLLLRAQRKVMKKSSRTYQIEYKIMGPQAMIKFEAPFDICKYFIGEADKVFQGLRSATSVFTMKAPMLLQNTLEHEEGYIEQVARLTATHIVRRDSSRDDGLWTREFSIHYIGPGTNDLEDAERLLKLKFSEWNPRYQRHSGCIIHKEVSKPLAIVPIEIDQDDLAADRTPKRVRLAYEVNKRNVDRENDTPSLTEKEPGFRLTEQELSEINRFFETSAELQGSPRSSPESSDFWETEASTEPAAVFGQFGLLAEMAQSLVNPEKPSKEEYATTDDSVFVSQLPAINHSLGGFSLSKDLEDDVSTDEAAGSLWVTLLPEPASDASNNTGDALPELELEFVFSEDDGDAVLEMARFIKHQSELDLLLPSRESDIQFRRKSYVQSKPGSIDPALLEFASASQLNLQQSERLRTPSHVDMTVPKQALTSSQGTETASANQEGRTRYSFAKLEYRSTLRLKKPVSRQPGADADAPKEHYYTYTSTEGGRLGGRREEFAAVSPLSNLDGEAYAEGSSREFRTQDLIVAVVSALDTFENSSPINTARERPESTAI